MKRQAAYLHYMSLPCKIVSMYIYIYIFSVPFSLCWCVAFEKLPLVILSLTVASRQTGHYHVSITDGLHFVNVVLLQTRIKYSILIVEKSHDLKKRTNNDDNKYKLLLLRLLLLLLLLLFFYYYCYYYYYFLSKTNNRHVNWCVYVISVTYKYSTSNIS